MKRFACLAVMVCAIDALAGPLDGGPSESNGAADEASLRSNVASFANTKLKDTPAVVTVITREDIRSLGARDLIDVLYLVPGFFFGVDQLNVVGPGFRGLWGYEGKILLIVDGHEMNELLYSTTQLGNEVPLDLVERVEVVRGPGSVIYGGNAELAVINVITRGAQGSTDALAAGNYGVSTDTGQTLHRRFTVSGREVVDALPGLSFFGSASFGQAQRSTRTYQDDFLGSAPMSGQSALNTTVAQAAIGYRDFQANFMFHRMWTDSIDTYTTVTTPPTPNIFDSYHADFIYTLRPTDRVEIVPRLTFQYQEPWKDSDPASTSYYDKLVTRTRVRLIGRWAPIDALQLTLGVDYIHDHSGLVGGSASTQTPTGLPTFQTLYSSPTCADGNPCLGAISYETFAAFAEAYSENPIVNVVVGGRFEHNSYVGDSIVPRVVLVRSFGDFSAKGIFSQAFREPGFENINTNLAITPERTTVFELEAGYDITRQMRASVNIFDVGIQSDIVFSLASATATSEIYQNLGREGSAGVEAEYRFRGKWGSLAATYSFYTPSGLNNIAKYAVPNHPESFLSAPSHRATLAGHYNILPWLSIGPTAVLLGPRYGVGAVDPATGNSLLIPYPTQLLLNVFLRAQLPFVKGLEAGLGFYNVLDTPYAFIQPYDGQHAPLPGLDREVMLHLSYLFEPAGD